MAEIFPVQKDFVLRTKTAEEYHPFSVIHGEGKV